MKKEDDKSNGKGKEVNLCHSMREEVEVPGAIRSAIFLKHPGDQDDYEEEAEEEGELDMDMEEESRERDSPKNFIKNRKELAMDKIKTQFNS